MNKKGFTLIELLAVIIILAILMIIAVPNILQTLSTAKQQAFKTETQSLIKSAEQQYIIDSMTGRSKETYNTGDLNLSGGRSGLTYSIELNKNGTLKKATVIDSNQKLKAVATSRENIAITNSATGETVTGGSTSGSGSGSGSDSGSSSSTPTTYVVKTAVFGATITDEQKTQNVNSGESTTITVTPNTNYVFGGYRCNGSATKSISNGVITLSNITSNVTCGIGYIEPLETATLYKGDCDGDGDVDNDDSKKVLEYAVSSITFNDAQKLVCDMNGNSSHNSQDSLGILNIIDGYKTRASYGTVTLPSTTDGYSAYEKYFNNTSYKNLTLIANFGNNYSKVYTSQVISGASFLKNEIGSDGYTYNNDLSCTGTHGTLSYVSDSEDDDYRKVTISNIQSDTVCTMTFNYNN